MFQKRIAAALLASLLCPALLAARPAANQPSLEELMRLVVARAKWEDENKIESRYASAYTTLHIELDAAGNATKRTERQYEPALIEGEIYNRLVMVNGQPVAGKDLDKERQREKKFRDRIVKRKASPQKKGEEEVELNEEFIKRYHFSYAGMEQVAGHPAHVLTFRPKSNLPQRKQIEKLLNRLSGRVWVDEKTSAISRIECFLTEPTSLYFFLGSMRELMFKLEKQPVDEGVWMPARMDVSMHGRKLFSDLHLKIQTQYGDYKKLAELVVPNP